MNWFADTSVWSRALRRDAPDASPQTEVLRRALLSGEPILTTGWILQELLQGFAAPERIARSWRGSPPCR